MKKALSSVILFINALNSPSEGARRVLLVLAGLFGLLMFVGGCLWLYYMLYHFNKGMATAVAIIALGHFLIVYAGSLLDGSNEHNEKE